jgi:hypothetical protein
MIKLALEFISGVGGFSAEPLTYKQIKRTDTVALYQRSRAGVVKDYEVFIIQMDPKGKVLTFPGGVTKTVEEDIEKYAITSAWGRLAWTFKNPGGAGAKFDELVQKGVNDAIEEETPEKTIIVPDTEFTIGELAEKNGVEYPQASLFIKEAIAANSVKFLREERRHIKGKASKVYAKA